MSEICVICQANAVYEKIKYDTVMIDGCKVNFLFRTLECSVCESRYSNYQQSRLNKLAAMQAYDKIKNPN